MSIDGKKLEKAIYGSFGLLIAYVGSNWFSTAFGQPNFFVKMGSIAIALIFLTFAIYQIISD